MTKSLTLAGLPRAGKKLPMILDKRTNMKDLSKTWVLTGRQFEDFRRKKKEQKHYSRPFKKPIEHTAPKYSN